jgi:hypothetical protein
MLVEQVDFVSVPTRDVERAVAWYRGFLRDPDGNTVILHRRYAPRGQA